MALNFDTTLGTSPASWYPQLTLANGAAAAPSAAGALDTSSLFGPSASPSAPSGDPLAAPAPSLTSPEQSGLDFASLFPYLKLGVQGAGYAGLPGTGALGGLLNLGSGVATGNPGQIGQGALGLVSGANSLFNSSSTLGGLLDAPIGATLSDAFPALASGLGAVSSYVPVLGSILGGALAPSPGTMAGGNAASTQVISAAAASAIAAAMANPIGAAAAPILGVVLAINQALNPRTNAAINKEAGQIGPSATAGLGSINNLGQQVGDFNSLSTPDLEQFVKQAGGALMGGYNPEGAGTGTSTSQTAVSRYMSANPGQAATNISADQNYMLQAIGALQKRGVDPSAYSGLFDSVLEPGKGVNSIYGLNTGGMDPRLAALMPTGYGNPGVASGYGTGNYGDNFNSPTFQAQALGGSTWELLSKMGLLSQPDLLTKYGVTPPALNQSYLASLKNQPAGQTMDQSQFWGPSA